MVQTLTRWCYSLIHFYIICAPLLRIIQCDELTRMCILHRKWEPYASVLLVATTRRLRHNCMLVISLGECTLAPRMDIVR